MGLNGEVRRVGQVERRLVEAARHGFRRALVPKGNGGEAAGPGMADAPSMEIVPVESLRQAMAECGLSRSSSALDALVQPAS